MSEFPQIFAFYSFKGGVGRSMALLNVAYALAAKGRHVLVLDMDLEAPGVSGFLHREGEIPGFARLDMVDLVGWAKSIPLPLAPESFPPLSDYAVSVPRERLESIPRVFSDLGRLDIIPVDEERDYYSRLPALALNGSDQNDLVRIGSVLRAWLKSLRFPIEVPDYYGPDYERTATYDYVLVDSRTGITETGGLCIGPLSDRLIVLTALNDQNVEGTRKFLQEVGIPTKRERDWVEPKPCLIVASLVPSGEIETKRRRLESLEQALGEVRVKLSYHPQLALKESIFTRDYRNEYLAHEYDELLQQVLRIAADGADPALSESMLKLVETSAEFRESLRKLTRSVSVTGAGSSLYHVLSRRSTESLSEVDYILWDRVCRVLSSESSPTLVDVLERWANLLLDWGLNSQDTELAALRYEAASIRCDQILQDREASTVQVARALVIRGIAHHQRGDAEKATADYTAVVGMPNAPTDQKATALHNRGVIHSERGDTDEATADYNAVIEMADTLTKQQNSAYDQFFHHIVYGQAISPAKLTFDYTANVSQMFNPLVSQKVHSLIGRAILYCKRGEVEKAIADYTAVIDLYNSPVDLKAVALCNRGKAYIRSGRYNDAISDERQAIAFSRGLWEAHAHLALALLLDGRTADSLDAYDAALAFASLENLDEMTAHLRDAIEKLDSIPGSEEVMARVDTRRNVLGQHRTSGAQAPHAEN